VVDRPYPAPVLSLREITAPVTKRAAGVDVEVTSGPLNTYDIMQVIAEYTPSE